MKILLDTSAYVGFKRNNAELVDIIVGAELILFSSVVLGELLFRDQERHPVQGKFSRVE